MSPYDLGKGWVMSLPHDPIRRPLLAPWYRGWMENQLPTRSLKLGKTVFFPLAFGWINVDINQRFPVLSSASLVPGLEGQPPSRPSISVSEAH